MNGIDNNRIGKRILQNRASLWLGTQPHLHGDGLRSGESEEKYMFLGKYLIDIEKILR